MVRLFFSELANEDKFHALIREQAAVHRKLLARDGWRWQRCSDRPAYARRALTISAGLVVERALLAFWEELADERAPTGGQRPWPTLGPSAPFAGSRHGGGRRRIPRAPPRLAAEASRRRQRLV